MDVWGSSDGFISVEFSGTKMRTATVKDTLTPDWKEQLRLPVGVPTMSDAIRLELFDEDWGQADDFIGSMTYSFREILDKGDVGVHWNHLYGWPEDASKEAVAAAQKAGERPNDYKGSVLIGASAFPDASARSSSKSVPMPGEPETAKYVLRCDVFQVAELPESISNRKVYVEVGFGLPTGKTYKKTKSVTLQGTASMEWLEKRTGGIEIKASLPKIKRSNLYNESQIPDIFIKLMYNGYCVGWNKVKYNLETKKTLSKGTIKWYNLKADRFSGYGPKDDGGAAIPGYLQYRLQFGEISDCGRAAPWPATNYQDYIVRAHMYQGKGLTAADSTGMSDPFLEIRMGANKIQTSVQEQTLFPRWYETVEMTMKLPTNQEMRPDVNVLIFDEDIEFAWTSADYLGRFVVPSKQIQAKFCDTPTYYDVMVGDEETAEAEGQVLCSFQLIRASEAKRVKEKGDWGPPAPSGIAPPLEACVFEVFLIGIRNMEPYNLMDIQSPIVEIDGGDAKTLMRSSPGSGPNYSWMQLLKMKMDLPDDPLFAPNVNLRVIDQRGKEVNVGNGSIPIAPYMKWTPKRVKLPETNTIRAAGGFAEMKDEDAPDSDEEENGQAYYPTNYDDLNEMVDEEFLKYTFENRVKSDGKSAGGGGRTLKNVEKTAVSTNDDDGDQEDGLSKPKPREILPTQWELSKADMIEWKNGDKGNKGGFDKDCTVPFDEYHIKRGQKRGAGIFSAVETIAGTVKVKCRAYKDGSPASLLPNLEERHKGIGRDQRMHLRLYVIQGMNLMTMDDNGFSDPFLNVSLTNHQKIMDKQRTLRQETLQPLFYVMYEFRDCNMPGDHTLTVEVWDADVIGDDLIGKAKIDVENRWYCHKWTDHPSEFIAKRPKELVPLWSPMSGVPQGRLEIWIDTLTDSQDGEIPKEKLVMPKGLPWQFRVVVWQVNNIVLRDKSSVDVFVTGTLEWKDVQDNKSKRAPRESTDTHWMIDAGDPGMFHWRWVIPCQIPCKEPRLLVQTWDNDLLSANDSLAEVNLALSGFFKKAASSDMRQRTELDVNMTHPNFSGVQSVVKLSLDVMPEDEARQQPKPAGREGPDLMKGWKQELWRKSIGTLMKEGAQGLHAIMNGPLKTKIMLACGCLSLALCLMILLYMWMSM